MPSLPNPYGPVTQVGSGMRSISNAIVSMGRMQGMGRWRQQRTAAQDAEDAANAAKLQAETVGQLQLNAATSPGALEQFGANVSGLPRDVFRRATALNQGGMPEGPIPEYGEIRPEHQQAAIPGNIASTFLAANPKLNPEQLFDAMKTRQQALDYERVMAGKAPVGTFGEAVAASKGLPLYDVADGTQYNKFTSGDFIPTPVGESKILQNKAAANSSNAAAGKYGAEKSKIDKGHYGPSVTIEGEGGVPTPRFLGQVSDTDVKVVPPPKSFAPPRAAVEKPLLRKAPSKAEMTMMENQLADTAGTVFEKLDKPSRAVILSRSTELLVDPKSPWHRNPAGAVEAAVKEMAPGGFEDAAGVFETARYVPKSGGRPLPRAPAPHRLRRRHVRLRPLPAACQTRRKHSCGKAM